MSNQVVEQWKKAQEGYQVAKNIAEELAASLAPAGSFNIPELLDRRRFEFGIPNGCFSCYPADDKAFVYQVALPGQGGDKYQGSVLIKPENVQSWERNTAPRGILVSAGLRAMDTLHSSGIEIGHIIRFRRLSPFIMPVAEFSGKVLSVMLLRDGDIVASEDLATKLHSRTHEILNISKTGYDFRIVGAVGNTSGEKLAADYDPSV